MRKSMHAILVTSAALLIGADAPNKVAHKTSAPPGSRARGPDLTPGVWKKITPAGVTMTLTNHVFCQGVTLDPARPSTIYLCVCAYDVEKGGLYKTTDGGATWARIGKLDEPIHVAIDPNDSNHLYCVNGVRGATQGFWVSRDGGETWTCPAGFRAATQKPVGTSDLYAINVDPTDFKHVLVSFHSPWANSRNCGVLESKDGGESWIAHNAPEGSAGGYGMAVFFLYNRATRQGDARTWLFTAQQGGFFRTTDGGATWKLVYKLQMTHGGEQLYRTKDGTLYAGAYQYPVRSTDNGASWEPLKKGLVYSWYMGICGDGTNLYTACSNENQPFFTSPESDGTAWTAYEGGEQKFSNASFEMRYDAVNRIVYSASWGEGLLR